MKAVVLAAGSGSRLAPLELGVPKPLAPISGRPLLDYSLGLLRQHGIRDVAINLWHLGDQIAARYGDGRALGLNIHYLFETSLSGTAGAVRQLKGFLQDDDFLVFYGDLLTDVDLTEMMRVHVCSGADATIAIRDLDDPKSRGVVWLGDANRITRFVEKPGEAVTGPCGANAGIYVLANSVLHDIPEQEQADFGRDVFPYLLNKQSRLFAYRIPGVLFDIGQPQDYAIAECAFRQGRVRSYADW
jgi:NDP-sugar pyrophosphorylase family protein